MTNNYNYIIVLFLSLFSYIAFGQVGIGTILPDASAVLEVTNGNKGTLMPRVSLNDVTDNAAPVAAPATGLLVYNTNAAVTGGVGTGIYFYNGTVWQPLAGTAGAAWAITGNSNTTPAANYVGTSDAQDFVISTNSTEAMRATSGGNLGIGTNAPTTDIHIANTVSASIILNETFEGGVLPAGFTTGGDEVWIVGNVPCSGAWSAEVDNALSNSEQSWLEYSTTIPATGGEISFDYAVSTEPNNDVFRFYIDGANEFEASGIVACTNVTYTLNPGPVTLRWEYTKSILFNENDDTPYLDNVVIREIPSPIIRIADGTEAANRILYTDVNGNGSWADAPSAFADDDWIFNSGSTNTDPLYHVGRILVNQTTYLAAESDFYINNGLSIGTQVGIGSVEYMIDDLNASLFSDSLEPATDNTYTLGDATFRWDTLFSTNGYTSTSDARFKQEIEPLTYGMDQLMDLRPVTYNWNLDAIVFKEHYKLAKDDTQPKNPIANRPKDDKKKIGFIAQELNKVIPEVVHTKTWKRDHKTGIAKQVEMETLGVSYSDLIPVLIKGIQEQQETLEKLKEDQNKLAKEIQPKK